MAGGGVPTANSPVWSLARRLISGPVQQPPNYLSPPGSKERTQRHHQVTHLRSFRTSFQQRWFLSELKAWLPCPGRSCSFSINVTSGWLHSECIFMHLCGNNCVLSNGPGTGPTSTRACCRRLIYLGQLKNKLECHRVPFINLDVNCLRLSHLLSVVASRVLHTQARAICWVLALWCSLICITLSPLFGDALFFVLQVSHWLFSGISLKYCSVCIVGKNPTYYARIPPWFFSAYYAWLLGIDILMHLP